MGRVLKAEGTKRAWSVTEATPGALWLGTVGKAGRQSLVI